MNVPAISSFSPSAEFATRAFLVSRLSSEVFMWRALVLDIETCPGTAYVWGANDQFISIEQIITPTSVLCFSAKWLGEKEVMFFSTQKDGMVGMIKAAHKLLCEADAVIHFNGASFDIPHLNAEFARLKLPPPSPFKQIDLKTVTQHKFRTISHKLAFQLPYYKIGAKLEHEGFSLWTKCIAGEKAAWDMMEKYNRQDTTETEKFYLFIRPWIERHPNITLYDPDNIQDEPSCPTCGSTDIQWRGYGRAEVYTYKRFQCNKCHKWSHARMSERAVPKPLLKGV
jgi:hypothetical protein